MAKPQTTPTEADEAVTAYLTSLTQPKQRGRAAKPKPDYGKALEGITDPLKLLAAAKAERERVDALAKAADPTEGFKRHAKEWAAVHGYAKDDFRAIGVPAKVLEAVFGSGKPVHPATQPAPRVSGTNLREHITTAPKGTVFTVAGLRTEVGGSDQTIAKVLKEALVTGTVSVAEDPNYTGRGRKPNIYTKL